MSYLEGTGVLIFDLLVRGALVFVAGYLLVAFTRSLSASHKHWVWTILFVSVLLIPVARLAPPVVHTHLPGIGEEISAFSNLGASPVSGGAGPVAGGESAVEPMGVGWLGQTQTLSITGAVPVASPLGDESQALSGFPNREVPSGFSLLGWIWMLGFIYLMGRASMESIHLLRLRKRSRTVVSGEWFYAIRAKRTALRIRRPVSVIVSSEIDTPMTWGALRPVIAYPAEAENWSRRRIEIAALHELLHIQRWDYVTHCIGWFTTALHWLNPLAWWALKEMLFERERACDDGVVRSGIQSTDYAHELVLLARQILRPTLFTKPHMTMKYSTTLKQRVEALLKPNQDRGTIGSFGRFGFSLFALAALLVMAPIPKPETATVSTDMLKIPASSAGFGIGASAVATIEPMLVQLSVVADDDTTGLARKLRELRKQLEQMKRELTEQEATLNAFTSEIDRMRVEGFSQEDELRLKERIAQAERDVVRATEQMGHQFGRLDIDLPEPPHFDPEIHEQALAQLRESMEQMKVQFESQEWKEQLEQNLRAAQEEMQKQLQSMQENIPTEEMKREMEQFHRQLIEEEIINREELQQAIRESQFQFREQTKQQMEQARQQLEEMRSSMPNEEELLSKISEAMEEARQSMPTKEIIKAEMARLQEHLQMMTEKLQQLERENNNQ